MRIVWLIVMLGVLTAPAAAQNPARWTLEVELAGGKVEGAPLRWSAEQVDLLARDGRIVSFAPAEAAGFRKTSETFKSYSASQVRAALMRELGGAFEVSGTGHYLVAHPNGQRDYWSPRFEDQYRSFVHYFSARGLRLTEPEFPLVAIAFPTQQEFLNYAAAAGVRLSPYVLGYYEHNSNRIALFDVGGGGARSQNWQEHSETIIHEATHQMAFNTGVHQRFSACPLWVAEGLATLFEAPGVWDAHSNPSRESRLVVGRLQDFRQYARRRPRGSLADLIQGDRLFQQNPGAAYAEAWALSFYLSETQPLKYGQFLTRVGTRSAFGDYPSNERMADFTGIFGADLANVESRFLRFVEDL